MRKKFLVSIVCLFLLACLVLPALGYTESLMIDYSTYHAYDDNPSSYFGATASAGVGSGYFAGNDEYLTQVSFYLKDQSGTLDVLAKCVVWNDTGDTFLVNSSAVSLTGVEADLGWFNFTFDATVRLLSTDTYLFGLFNTSALTGTLRIGLADSGNCYYYHTADSTWDTVISGDKYMMRVYTSDTYGLGSEGSEEDTVPRITDWDIFSSGVISWLIYLVILLLPAWFLGVFLKMGKWGFLIGLSIGAGLGYAFIENFPLWLLVLIAVGDVGLAYQTVNNGGA